MTKKAYLNINKTIIWIYYNIIPKFGIEQRLSPHLYQSGTVEPFMLNQSPSKQQGTYDSFHHLPQPPFPEKHECYITISTQKGVFLLS